jgi:cellulose synthase/poly-beta-1,6-N-acetylglucosamine synthase-like glycosyltransferase
MIHSTLKRQASINRDFAYSVIIPAYNEEALLPATLSGLHLAMDSIPHKGEIIVVDNHSTDNTKNIAKYMVPGWSLSPSGKLQGRVTPEPGKQKAIFLYF